LAGGGRDTLAQATGRAGPQGSPAIRPGRAPAGVPSQGFRAGTFLPSSRRALELKQEALMDFTGPLSRIDHAEHRAREAMQRFRLWAESDPFRLVTKIADDKMSVEVVLKLHQAPPVETWGFLLGESIHHLRCTLDNMTYAIAVSVGASRKSRTYFPICHTSQDWERSLAGKISVLPPKYQNAIRMVQPFESKLGTSQSGTTFLAVLNKLENHDKHRLQIRPVLPVQAIRHQVEVQLSRGSDTLESPDTEVFIPRRHSNRHCPADGCMSRR
jgi:hypothetical protein